MKKELTDSELLILGLVAEMPRHGYDLEQVIVQRGMRKWTQIGFSSIYFVLGKLEKKGLVMAIRPHRAKAKKNYTITNAGEKMLISRTLAALQSFRPTHSSFILGMIHWSVLTRDQALEALKKRKTAVKKELTRISDLQFQQQPLPDYIDAIFEYSLLQLRGEVEWITKTLSYMKTKPWQT